MKLTVFGATGGTGTEVVRQGVAAGHRVTAVVRDPARLEVARHELLDVVTADVFDPAAITSAVAGRDAVISALGPRGRGPSVICRDGTRGIMAAMAAAGVRRLVVVSDSGMHTEGDGFFTGRIFKPVLIRVLREGYADMRAMEELVRAADLDSDDRAPAPTGRPFTGRVAGSVGANVRGGFLIGRVYLLRVAADDTFVRVAVSVAQGW